jgi:phosphotriesterase-related protein
MTNLGVVTTLGPIPADELGIVMTHEHVFFRLDASFTQSEEDPDGIMSAAQVTPQLQWWLRSHPFNNRDNLVQESLETATSEVMSFKNAGGDTLVDVTTVGLAPKPKLLAEVSRRTGVHIIAATGFYTASSLPQSTVKLSLEMLADHMRRDLTQGIAGSEIRAGIIGELGVSTPPMPVELRVLAAAGKVQQELGCAISIHPAWGPDGAMLTAKLVEEAGIDPARTVLSHLDNRFREDILAMRELADRGFRLGLDCFGKECYYPHVNLQLPSDGDRIRAVLGLLDAGFEKQILLSQDICTKHQLTVNGGQGYAHVLQCVRPRLLRNGIDGATMRRLLVDNPRALLART